ncbi:hypothetical protein BGX28_008194 [Mortierella sp. GBA30]|nr:hypothetical protein BGX28_008194 [Mortierella sp. GBA30]
MEKNFHNNAHKKPHWVSYLAQSNPMLLTQTILFATALIGMTTAGKWCGKNYTEPTNKQPPVDHAGVFPALPSWPPADALAVTPRWKPIYQTDESVEFIIDVPGDTSETKITFDFGTGQTYEAPVHPGANIIAVPKAKAGEASTVTAILGSAKVSATFTIHKKPAPGTSVTVRVDYMHGSLVHEKTHDAEPVFPFGMYVDFDWLAKDPVRGMKELKDQGFNFAHLVSPYGQDNTALKAALKAAEEADIWVQHDMRHTYTNATSIIAEVNAIKTYESLVSWYTSDEPDGEFDVEEPRHTINAYNTVNSIDPHRPTMLVLNCMRNSASQFASAADVLMTDVYPVSIRTSACNGEVGDCGCDECVGNLAIDIRHRMHSYRAQLAQIGKPRLPVWMVLQAFSDPNTYWNREPTPAEFRLMSYISLIHGAKGIVSWVYPGNLTPNLRKAFPGLSAELVPLGSKYILGGKQILEYSDDNIVAGAWIKDAAKLLILVNPKLEPSKLTVGQSKAIFGDGDKLIEAGAVLGPYEVRVITV